MKIESTKPLTNLKGEIIKEQSGDFTIGKAISEILLSVKEGNKMKLFVLAQKIFNNDVADIDTVDLELIKSAVEQSQIYNNLVTGQILVYLTQAK